MNVEDAYKEMQIQSLDYHVSRISKTMKMHIELYVSNASSVNRFITENIVQIGDLLIKPYIIYDIYVIRIPS